MNCPYYNKPMEKGSLYSDKFNWQWWVPGDLSIKNYFKYGKRIEAQDYALLGLYINGFYCKDCKKLIIETELSD